MTRIRTKMIGAGLLMAGAVTVLALAGIRDGWVYFLPVDQFIETSSYHTQRVRLHGKVGTENLQENRALLQAQFDLKGHTKSVRVDYSGVIPEMFQADHDVVVEGRMDESGTFRADTLLTKCASKYESVDGEAPHADPYPVDSGGGQ